MSILSHNRAFLHSSKIFGFGEPRSNFGNPPSHRVCTATAATKEVIASAEDFSSLSPLRQIRHGVTGVGLEGPTHSLTLHVTSKCGHTQRGLIDRSFKHLYFLLSTKKAACRFIKPMMIISRFDVTIFARCLRFVCSISVYDVLLLRYTFT